MPDYKAQLQTVRIIHLALMAGPTLFAFVVVFLTINNPDGREAIEVLNYIAPAMFFFALASYPFLFRSAIKPALEGSMPLEKKITTFQTGHIIRLALLEGACLFSIVVVLLNGEMLHFITVGLILAIMFSKLPTPYLLESELKLSPDERSQLS